MELEHERVTEKEFGPKVELLKGRILGSVIIVGVLGFLALVLIAFPRGEGQAMSAYGPIDTTPLPAWKFILLSLGLVAAALIVPLLANIAAVTDFKLPIYSVRKQKKKTAPPVP